MTKDLAVPQPAIGFVGLCQPEDQPTGSSAAPISPLATQPAPTAEDTTAQLPSPVITRICPQCGRVLDEEDKFCPYCGCRARMKSHSSSP